MLQLNIKFSQTLTVKSEMLLHNRLLPKYRTYSRTDFLFYPVHLWYIFVQITCFLLCNKVNVMQETEGVMLQKKMQEN